MLLDLIKRRIPGRSLRRLVGKCLHVGVLDGEELSTSDTGTAQGSMVVLPKRMARFGLTLQPDKTRLIPFRQPRGSQRNGKGPGSLDLLCRWDRTELSPYRV